MDNRDDRGWGGWAVNDWKAWDENNPPPPGEYIVWHSRFRIPGEKVWSFRASRNGKFGMPDKVRWSYKKGQCVWFNDGNWQVDGAPEYYCPMPRFPGVRVLAAQQPTQRAEGE